MSAPWFHAPELPGAGETVSLHPDEARHAGGARRLESGDAVVLFDGAGGLADGTLAGRPTSRSLAVRVDAVRRAEPRRPEMHVAAALPKGDRQSTLLSMATQLGMASFTPLASRRSIAHRGRNADARWERIALAACKQSRNPWLPRFHAEAEPGAFGKAHADGVCILLHPDPDAEGLLETLSRRANDACAQVALLVGPEGGFSDREAAECRAAGASCAHFGDTILRTETAVVAALAVVRAHLVRDR